MRRNRPEDADGQRLSRATAQRLSLYLRCLPRWQREEMGRRTEELRRQHQPLQPQSREHVDHWNERAER